jgi:hypothetical protein
MLSPGAIPAGRPQGELMDAWVERMEEAKAAL